MKKLWVVVVLVCFVVTALSLSTVYAQDKKVFTFNGQSRMPSGNVFFESLVRACKRAEAARWGEVGFQGSSSRGYLCSY